MAQTLETMIVINATTGNGFSDVGNTLTQLGGEIDIISQKLIDFGKDSLDIYKGYEKNMAEAKGALAARYGKDTKELNDAMDELNDAAIQWAAYTRFHTDDIAEAINTAAHASWDANDITANMASAMELANAGSLDLSDALMYLVRAQKALGVETDNVGHFIDIWAYASSRSTGDIQSFGETFDALGSVGRFADSEEELLAITAIMHDMGTTGSAAATLMRTTWMRMLAPSGIAGKVLENLGATDEEINSIRQDTQLLNTLDFLEGYGFSAYDANGQAKPLLQTFSELRDILAEISGGYENIEKNQQALGILNTLFGMRGIKGGLNIFNGLETGLTIYDEMMQGMAEGYGEYYSETMMDTLWGSTEEFNSKIEELKRRTGEVLSSQIQPVMEIVGNIVNDISQLDTGSFNALVAGAEVLAAAGPGLLLAGGAFRFIGNTLAIFANPVAGGVAAASLAAIGIMELMAVMDEFEKADYAAQFGDMGLDNAAMMNYIQQVNQDFTNANKEINAFKDALDASVESYKTASSTFSSSIMQDVITGMEIKEGSEEYNKLTGLGDSMIAAIKDGITNSEAATMTSVTNLWGGDAESIDDPVWGQIISALETGYQEALDRAEALGKNLRQALMDAISNDGKLDAGELAGIQSIMDEMNRLMAEQAEVENYVKQQEILRNAQRLGLDATRELVGEMRNVNEANLETARKDNDYTYKRAELGFQRQIESGEITEDEAATSLQALRERQESQMRLLTAANENAIYDTLDLLISGSDLGEAWSALQTLGRDFREAGGIVTQEASRAFDNATTTKEAARITRSLEEIFDYLGGYDEIARYRDFFQNSGDLVRTSQYQNLLDMHDAMGQSSGTTAYVGTHGSDDYSNVAGTYSQIQALLSGAGTALTPEGLVEYMHMAQEQWQVEPDWMGTLGETLYYQMNNAARDAGYNTITEMIGGLETQLPSAGGAVSLAPYSGGDAAQALQDQGVQVSVNGDTTELQATIDAADGQTLMTYVDGDATNLSATITAQDGRTLVENVTGDASALGAAIDQYRNQTITVTVRANSASIPNAVRGFAEGGRSDVPAIFGEGDTAEWAIPEEHSARTAELLNAARAASGFTWPELLGLYGGLNANPGGGQTTLVYSPTIYAQDATGVEQKLAADKARLEKWFEEKQMKDGLEVYA